MTDDQNNQDNQGCQCDQDCQDDQDCLGDQDCQDDQDRQGAGFPELLATGLKKIFLAGVGAAATAVEMTEEVVGAFIKKGELTMEQGRVMGEELKRTIKEKYAEISRSNSAAERAMKAVDSLTPEERAALKAKLEALEGQGEEPGTPCE